MKLTIFFLILESFALANSPEMILRADKYQPYQLPNWSKMPSTSPACSNRGISMRFLSRFDGEYLRPALVQNLSSQIFQSKPFENDISISDVFLTKDYKSVFALNYRGGTEGVYAFDGKSTVILTDPKDFPTTLAMSRPSIVNGKVLFRSLHKNGLHTIYLGNTPLYTEKDKVAYLYLPTSKNNQIVFKVGLGTPGEVSASNKDKIISVFKGVESVVAVDQDLDSESKFIEFDNSPIPDGLGGTAFIAKHEDFGRSLWHAKVRSGSNKVADRDLKMIYSEKEGGQRIEFFSPAINATGDLVFRTLKNKVRTVLAWSSKKNKIITLMTQGQLVASNESGLQIMNRNSWPAFSGRPCVNNKREVFVHGVLEHSETKENKGSAVFKFKL